MTFCAPWLSGGVAARTQSPAELQASARPGPCPARRPGTWRGAPQVPLCRVTLNNWPVPPVPDLA